MLVVLVVMMCILSLWKSMTWLWPKKNLSSAMLASQPHPLKKNQSVDVSYCTVCANPPQGPTLMGQDISLMPIQVLSPTPRNVRCIMCHDEWSEGIECSCGAVYHKECAGDICGTLGCNRMLNKAAKNYVRVTSNYPNYIERVMDTL